MKEHVLSALREQFERWEALLAGLSEAQVSAPLPSSEWSIKDNLAHLWAWQQRSIARMEAALYDREPVYPAWRQGADPDVDTERTNAWIYAACRDLPWAKMHQDWREGFLHFLEAANRITERDLLDSSKYPWMDGRPLVLSLLASYDHHQEHYEKLLVCLG
ncbi:MAG: ClbS/DfsB family four-helix bundle protein [Anaerolineaceae bacterium]|nr:ClbS/DfsB family four-helix bundle protein [Anaerolineaceae bacterium]